MRECVTCCLGVFYTDVERAMTRVKAVYEAAGAKDHFLNQWGGGGHKFYPDIMWPFIQEQLVTKKGS